MTDYRKLPVVIQAVQFRPGENDEEMLALLGNTPFLMDGGGIVLPTLEGQMIAIPGDYVIKGIKGEVYPCKPDIFEATYEEIS